MRKNIRILNPISGQGWTSRNRAKRFVKHGQAVWVEFGSSIRFIDPHHRTASVEISKEEARRRCGYDLSTETECATLDAIAGLPVLNVLRLITDTSKSPHCRALGRNGPVRHV